PQFCPPVSRLPAEESPSGLPAEQSPSGLPAEELPSGLPAQGSPSGLPAEATPSGLLAAHPRGPFFRLALSHCQATVCPGPRRRLCRLLGRPLQLLPISSCSELPR